MESRVKARCHIFHVTQASMFSTFDPFSFRGGAEGPEENRHDFPFLRIVELFERSLTRPLSVDSLNGGLTDVKGQVPIVNNSQQSNCLSKFELLHVLIVIRTCKIWIGVANTQTYTHGINFVICI